jgi:two-component system, NarL family, sensor histidine kinase UhpB
MSLAWRIFLIHAGVLVAAGLVLAISPATVSSPPSTGETLVLGTGIAAVLVVSLFLLRRAMAPLSRLATLMDRVDPMHPGRRVDVAGGGSEVEHLARAFNAMLDRLETERRESVRRALGAQESERQRVAQELHDEVGQTLTAVLLRLDRAAMTTDDPVRTQLLETEGFVRDSLEDVRGIAQRLRPEALDDLGLGAALLALVERIRESGTLDLRERVEGSLDRLDQVAELVIYRVAQEALTNVVRHADATTVEVALRCDERGAELTVADDGRGLSDPSMLGSGIAGMRERALLVDGELEIESSAGQGCRVRLTLPPRVSRER